MQEDYQGNPIVGTGDVLKQAGRRMLPISLEGLLIQEGRAAQTRATTTAAGLLGLRSFPAPRRELLDDVATSRFGRPYAELTPVEQAQVGQDERLRAYQPSQIRRPSQ